MKIFKSGFRKDLKSFFNQYVLTTPSSKRQPSPFLVVDEESVMKCDTIDELLEYSDSIEVLQTWPGKVRSDVFYFTVADLRKHIEKGE